MHTSKECIESRQFPNAGCRWGGRTELPANLALCLLHPLLESLLQLQDRPQGQRSRGECGPRPRSSVSGTRKERHGKLTEANIPVTPFQAPPPPLPEEGLPNLPAEILPRTPRTGPSLRALKSPWVSGELDSSLSVCAGLRQFFCRRHTQGADHEGHDPPAAPGRIQRHEQAIHCRGGPMRPGRAGGTIFVSARVQKGGQILAAVHLGLV
jgi:hypothetical protein